MTLKKIKAAHFDPNRNYIDQKEVDMSPEEASEINAHWATGNSLKNMPKKPTQADEHEWLIEYGPEYVKQKRAEWEVAYKIWDESHQPLVDFHRRAAISYEQSTKG